VFEPNNDVTFQGKVEESGPERKEGFDKFFQMDLVSYKTQAFFSQVIKTSGHPTVTGELEFATCNEEMCLPPDYVAFAFDLSKEPGFVSGAVVEQLSSANGALIEGEFIDQMIPSIVTTYQEPLGDCADEGEETAAGKSLIWTFVLGFLGGLLALLTPCVFPMIPLTVSYFSKDTKRKGWVNGAI
jgi:thiol:disulfide interchange protein DsbD